MRAVGWQLGKAQVKGLLVRGCSENSIFKPQCTNPPMHTTQDMIEYGIIDEVIQPDARKAAAAAAHWVKSGRAEGEGRLEQWAEYLQLQEKYSLKDSFRKVCSFLKHVVMCAVF